MSPRSERQQEMWDQNADKYDIVNNLVEPSVRVRHKLFNSFIANHDHHNRFTAVYCVGPKKCFRVPFEGRAGKIRSYLNILLKQLKESLKIIGETFVYN